MSARTEQIGGILAQLGAFKNDPAYADKRSVAYCVRNILNKQPLEQNRALVSLNEKLVPDYNSSEAAVRREQISADFARGIGL